MATGRAEGRGARRGFRRRACSGLGNWEGPKARGNPENHLWYKFPVVKTLRSPEGLNDSNFYLHRVIFGSWKILLRSLLPVHAGEVSEFVPVFAFVDKIANTTDDETRTNFDIVGGSNVTCSPRTRF
eukprot:1503472-Rhodomonas_salina.2